MVISDSDEACAARSRCAQLCLNAESEITPSFSRPRQYREASVFPSFAVRRRHCECQRQKATYACERLEKKFSTQFESNLTCLWSKLRSDLRAIFGFAAGCIPCKYMYTCKVTHNLRLLPHREYVSNCWNSVCYELQNIWDLIRLRYIFAIPHWNNLLRPWTVSS